MSAPDLAWGHPSAPLVIRLTDDAPARVALSDPAGIAHGPGAEQALVEVALRGHGRSFSSARLRRSVVGERLRPVSHTVDDRSAVVVQRDPVTGLVAETRIVLAGEAAAYRFVTTLRCDGDAPVVVDAVATAALGGLTGAVGETREARLWTARHESYAENRWSSEPLAEGLPWINPGIHRQPARGVVERTGTSTWSTGAYQPGGVIEGPRGAVAWEIEVSGPWRWEVASLSDPADWLSLALMGPSDEHHAWNVTLAPGEELTTVPATVAVSPAGFEGAVAALTQARRAAHRPQPAGARDALIYNDYMNTLMGDPTEEKLLPLIAGAAAAGADIFCIDAGWYDDGHDWWPSVGEWLPSTRRFPTLGLGGVLQRIRDAGMRPGLWVEPEVVGVRSPLADTLPEEAFMRRGGRRIVAHDRYFLDLRSEAARAHLDRVFARLIEELGAEYVKWDYNVTPGIGPGDEAPGAALLDHSRSLLSWFDALRDRYPHAVIEACASGANRQDSAILRRFDLHSTSDQQDPLLYPPIAAGALMAMPPEQAGNWAYPHAGMSVEEAVLTLVTGLSGRMYLAGHLDRLPEPLMAAVREACATYREVIAHQQVSVPFWPLGLPRWEDGVVCAGTRASAERGQALVCVWNRDGAESLEVPLDGPVDSVEQLFPDPDGEVDVEPWTLSWDAEAGTLGIGAPAGTPSARVLRVTYADAASTRSSASTSEGAPA
ncbi:glycoside hydrolase family 36 protein [Demequina mangrovi]|uniref:Alpha-galactosidase n=1 Tax=Demequina mangrovi TaxID=1043493 RepID=A0A1H6WFD6_9MICO|nr:glycoside hydrolase family 36 protein [Demequina mangrovi]SEJ11045.1 alpha-galactosidase [Demequina mangrovi]